MNAPGDSRREIRHALIAVAAVFLLLAVLGAVSAILPFVSHNLGVLVAAGFLLASVSVAHLRAEDIAADHGFWSDRPARELVFGLAAAAVVFPLFTVGFAGFYATACGDGGVGQAVAHALPRGLCARYAGFGDGAGGPGALDLLRLFGIQLVVVAIPEELFFRGTVHGLLERAIPPTRRLFGGGIGWALIASSVLFALAHVIVTPDPRRLAVFFPALLFGWMRSATRSILPAAFVHAAANLLLYILFATTFS